MVSFTMDVWIAPTPMPFLGITTHFINSNWNLYCKTFDFKPLPGSHSREMLAQAFQEILNFYGIIVGKNHGGITLDNACNNNKFIDVYDKNEF